MARSLSSRRIPGAVFDTLDQQPADGAAAPGDHRRPLQSTSETTQPAALPDRRPHDQVREASQGVGLDVGDAGRIAEQMTRGSSAASAPIER
jgi:hypothetical protein